MTSRKAPVEIAIRHLQAQMPGLLIFDCVARHMNFARAAEELMVTPTAVSKTIKGLEAQVGVRLFNRNTRSVALTEAGHTLLGNLKPALEQIKFSLTDVVEHADRPAGLLRLTTSYVAYATLIEPHVQAFLAQYPEITLEISLDSSLVDIVDKGFDAGIRLGHAVQRDMIVAPLGPIQTLVAVASPDYLAHAGTPQHPNDLLQHICVRQRLSNQARFFEWSFLIEGKPAVIDVHGQFIVDEMRLAAAAAQNGVGIAYVFRHFIDEALQSGKLTALLPQYSQPRGAFHIYYPSKRHMSPKLRIFIDHIRAANWAMPR